MPSLPEAIDTKFGPEEKEENLECGNDFKIFVPRENPRQRLPSVLVLENCDINCAGDESDVCRNCQSVRELDLGHNKLTDWDEVLKILKPIQRLSFLNLSFNELSQPLVPSPGRPEFLCLTKLILNGTYIKWPSIHSVLHLMPKVEELYLALNELHSVDLHEEDMVHPSVKTLHYNGNPLSSPKDFHALGEIFPELHTLVVAECPLSSLGPGSELAEAFPDLTCLNINSTHINSWDDVDGLRSMPNLKDLRFLSCPILEEYTDTERRQLVIARLPNIETLNGGGVITHTEREDAERSFIRTFMNSPEPPSRYTELIEIHGKLDPLCNIDLKPNSHVTVSIKCHEQEFTRKISVYQTVADFKRSLNDIAGVPPAKMMLWYVDKDAEDVYGPEEMKFKDRMLYRYNLQSGDSFIVHVKETVGSPTK